MAAFPANDSAASVPAVTIAFMGDVMLGRGIDPSLDSFSYIQPFLDSADLALANLESPLTDEPPQAGLPYVLCGPRENAKYLGQAGFEIISFVNNHVGDCGAKGKAETLVSLSGEGIQVLEENEGPLYFKRNGVLLAFLAFNAVNGLDLQQALGWVSSARERGAVVIVSMHWGMEYQSAPTPEQVQWAEQFSEAGASVIWGHHPHVLQPAEWINAGKTLVLYSLGNALFDQHGLAVTRQSAIALIRVNANGVVEFRAEPFVIDVPASRIMEASPEEKQIIGGYFDISPRPSASQSLP